MEIIIILHNSFNSHDTIKMLFSNFVTSFNEQQPKNRASMGAYSLSNDINSSRTVCLLDKPCTLQKMFTQLLESQHFFSYKLWGVHRNCAAIV